MADKTYTLVVEEAVMKDGDRTVGRIKYFRTGYGSTTGGDYGNFRPTFDEAKDALIEQLQKTAR
jgi:hypothetical protein